MIRRRKKICRKCRTEQFLFGKGLCDSCYKKEHKKAIKVVKKLNKVSKKQRDRNKKYNELRYTYLREHPICECDCTNKATEIHHKGGRTGDSLYNFFLAVCNECHRRIEENPEWAKEQGYSISRLK